MSQQFYLTSFSKTSAKRLKLGIDLRITTRVTLLSLTIRFVYIAVVRFVLRVRSIDPPLFRWSLPI